MFRIQRDYMIEQLSTETPDPTLCDAVLPRAADAGSDRFEAATQKEFTNCGAELCIAIEDHVAVGAGKCECFPELLQDPVTGRMRGGMKKQDLATAVLDDEETVKNPESHRGHGEEVEGRDDFPAIVQEGEPALCFLWMTMVFQS